MNRKSRFVFVSLLLIIVSIGFINLPPVEAQTQNISAAYLQQLISQLNALIAQLQQQLLVLQGQAIGQRISTSINNSTTTSSITVTVPGGGSYEAGSELPVRWWSQDLPPETLVDVRVLNSADRFTGATSVLNTINDGRQNLVLNSQPAPGQYRVRITTTVNGETITGWSRWFTITASSPSSTSVCPNGNLLSNSCLPASGSTGNDFTSPPSPPIPPGPVTINVSSPPANSSWTVNNGPVIYWSDTNIPDGNTILVELWTPNNQPATGFSNFTTANDGVESGRLTNSSLPTGAYWFRLSTVVNGQNIYGGSGIFQFTAAPTSVPPPPATTCGNGLIEGGEQCDGNNFGSLTCGSYGYSLGSLICSGSCTLNTTQCTNPPPAQTTASINVTAPLANNLWRQADSPKMVTWTSSNVPNGNLIRVELMTPNNQLVSNFTPSLNQNTGSKNVAFASITPGSYWFRLSTVVNGETIYGGSGIFQIGN